MLSKFPIYILGIIANRSGRFIDPHWKMEVDFSILSDGGHPSATLFTETAAQGTNQGFTFTRSTTSTVQVAGDGVAQPVISGIPVDAACIGSIDGVKRGLVLQPQRISAAFNSTSPGYSGARHIYAHGDVVAIYNPSFHHSSNNPDEEIWTNNSGTGADGAATAAIAIGSTSGLFQGSSGLGSYAPWLLLDDFFNIELNMNAWYKGTGKIHQTWTLRIPWDNFNVENLRETVSTATGQWQRISCVRDANSGINGQFAGVLAYGPDISSYGSITNGSTYGGLVDFIDFQHNQWLAESIDAIDGIRAGDRLSYAAGLDSFANGQRLRLYFSFYPKHTSTESVAASVVLNADSSVQDMTLFSTGSGASRVWAAIEYSTPITRGIIKFHSAENIAIASTEQIAWSRYDFVEIMLEVGDNQPTTFKYRTNGGSWIDFTSLNAFTLNTMAPAGTVYFGTNGTDDINTPACWLKEIRAYDLTGAPI